MMRLTGTVTFPFDYRLEREDGDVNLMVVAEWDRDHGSGEVVSIAGPRGSTVDLTAKEWKAIEEAVPERAWLWDDGAAEDEYERRREMREER